MMERAIDEHAEGLIEFSAIEKGKDETAFLSSLLVHGSSMRGGGLSKLVDDYNKDCLHMMKRKTL